MRPIAVTMAGFGTFSDPVTVDFEGADVFALVGPTGSGKSTIIDAICFALYGSIPRYDDRRAVGAAVHALAVEARVSLTFELGGTRYVAARVVRRDKHGKASTKDARLEELDGEVLAGTAREMDTVVPKLLGLSFDQFTRAVVLPQGEFARFLHDKPAARQDLLVQLLGLDVYERMMQRARARATEGAGALTRDRERIAVLAGATAEVRLELERHVGACTAARSEWRAAKPELDGLFEAAMASEEVVATERGIAERLRAVDAPADLASVALAVATAADLVATSEEAAERAAGLVTIAETALAAAGDRDALLRAREMHERHGALGAQVQAAGPRVGAARAESERNRMAMIAADEHADELRTANAAYVVRSHLRVGEPCPVCEQLVENPPGGSAPDAWQGARDEAKASRERADRTATALVRAEAELEDLERRRAELVEAMVGLPSIEQAQRGLARIEILAKDAAECRRADHTARATEKQARAVREDANRSAQWARQSFRDQRDALTATSLVPPSEGHDVATDWDRLCAWAATEAPLHDAAADAGAAHADSVRMDLTGRLSRLVEAAVALGLEMDRGAVPGLNDLLEAAAAEERSARDRLAQLDGEIRERGELLERVTDRSGDVEVATELARLLDANHFERWLVSEALGRLVDGGSERFQELSSGRYSFAFDDSGRDLLVVDHLYADERRSVRTLSGGETFQASLALALALADQLAGLAADGATRLEAIFLDEGFGTLDAETLEVVAATIENLGSLDRMVGIVTHVPELAARLAVQYRVTKGAGSSTVERVTQ